MNANPLSHPLRSIVMAAVLGTLAAAIPAAAQAPAVPAAEAETPWSLARSEEPVAGAGDVLETVWQASRPPAGPYDRIGLHRFRTRDRIGNPARAALLYLPGTFMNGEVAVAEEEHNLWLFLARRGVEVYILDYRTHALPAEGMEGADLAFLRRWTAGAFVADAAAAAAEARRESGRERLFVAGFSRGAGFAYALAASREEPRRELAGLVILDGYFKHHAPRAAFDFPTAVAELEASGRWHQDVGGSRGWAERQRLMRAAAEAPAASLTTAYGEGPAGEQLARVLQFAWGPGALANPMGGVSRVEVLARLMAGYDRYYPAIQDAEGQAIADHEDAPHTALDDGWAALEIPVLYFGTTGAGPTFLLHGIASAGHAGGADTEIHVLEGYGHLDVLVAEDAREDVFEPILRWIGERSE